MPSAGEHVQWVERYWDNVASAHDRTAAGGVWDRGRPVDVFPELAAEYVERLAITAADEVLEVGAGSGALTLAMRPHVARIVATDLSAKMLEHLSGAGIETHHCEAAALPFADASFDKAYFHGVSQYFPDLDYARRAVAEMLRVTRPGGRVLLGDVMNGRIFDDYQRFEASTIAVRQKPKYYLIRMLKTIRERLGRPVPYRGYLAIRPEFFTQLLAGTPHRALPLLETVMSKPEHFLRYRYDVLILKDSRDPPPA